MKTLKGHLRQAIVEHLRDENGLVTAPDRLVDRMAGKIAKWIETHDTAKFARFADVDRHSCTRLIDVLSRDALGETDE